MKETQYFSNARGEITRKDRENRDHNWDCKVTCEKDGKMESIKRQSSNSYKWQFSVILLVS